MLKAGAWMAVNLGGVDDDGTAATDTGYCQSYPSVCGSS